MSSENNKRLAKKVLLIGWGSADWKVLNPIMKIGKLPNLKELVDTGTKATLGALDPPLPPAAWTSIVTGKIPYKHQIHSFTEVAENAILPISSNSKKALALWEILSHQNLKVHQVGCWASHPTTSINGISVSDLYPYYNKETLSEDAIFPKNQKDTFANFLVDSSEITDKQLAMFAPHAKWNDEAYQTYKQAIVNFLAQTQSLHNAAKHILETEEWDQMSVFYNQLSALTSLLMPFHVAEYKKVDTNMKKTLNKALVAAYQHLDNMLGELMDLVGEETTIFLVSQGGYLPDKLWVEKLKRPHSRYEFITPGIFVFNGQSASQKEEFFGVTALDIAPTILALLGAPFAKDFDGKITIAPQFFEKVNTVVESFERPQMNLDKKADLSTADLLELQLAELEYAANSKYNLEENYEYLKARSLMNIGQQLEAVPILEDLWARYPYNYWYGGRLAGCYLSVNRPEEGIELLDTVLDIVEGIPDLHLLRGQVLMANMKFRSAVTEFDKAEANIGMMGSIYPQIADAYLKMHQHQEAIVRLNKEIEINPTPAAYLTLAMVYIQKKQIKKAIEPLEKTVEIAPQHPLAWFHLATGYYQAQEYQKSADAFENAKKFNKDPKAQKNIQQHLVKLYRDHLNRPDKIKEMQEAYEKSIGSQGTVTIVSGLPRSGTSMMMQMLVKGGMEAFTDGKREADENNQKGYYEHDAVKGMARDKSFMRNVGNKVVKVISHLLFHLPHVYKYKIVFMDREIEEVMNSQHKMLGRLGKERGEDKENSMKLLKPFKESREKAIKWCQNNNKFVDILLVPYSEAINNPLEQAKKVNAFLGGHLDEMAMAAVVDASLYREKTSSVS